jgi:hypothetical protein
MNVAVSWVFKLATTLAGVASSARMGSALGNGAEIFTDDLHPMAVRLEIQYRVKLRRAVVNIDPVSGAKTFGHPKGAMQPHHMVDAQHAGKAHVMAQAFDIVAVALPADCFWLKRRKAPALALDKQTVGGRAAVDAEGEQISLAPDIVAVPVDAEGEVEIERGAAIARARGDLSNLLGALPLNVEMIELGKFVVVLCLKLALAILFRPVKPAFAFALGLGAKLGIVLRYRVGGDETFKRTAPLRRTI